MQAAADRLVNLKNETILVVAHSGTIRTMMCYLLGLEPRQYVSFALPYGALAVVELIENQGVLVVLERPDVEEKSSG